MTGVEQVKSFFLPASGPSSLTWHGDELVDWASGGARFGLDGSSTPASVSFGDRFDAAMTSPDGRFTVIYELLGTKALLLGSGKLIRELNRSFYHADAFEYPICLFNRNGRTMIAHCPVDYNRIQVEDAETGECLTQRDTDGKAADFFHSRLQVDQSGRRLVSAGWVWHPWDAVTFFDLDDCLANPTRLDDLDGNLPSSRHVGLLEEASATWVSDRLLLITAGIDETDPEELELENPELLPNGYVVYDVVTREVTSSAVLDRPAGTVMPVEEDHFVAFYDFPRLQDDGIYGAEIAVP